MSVYISVVILIVAVLLCLKPSAAISFRVYFVLGILGWAALLLTFYMDGLVRAAALLTAPPQSTRPFFAGVLAYKQVLGEIRISIGLLLSSLALLALFPAISKTKGSQAGPLNS